jgi:hypothetical protein
MGCSYDHPSPSKEKVDLVLDEFAYNQFTTPATSTCLKCGSLVVGGPYSRGLIDVHISVCPGRVKAD